VLSEEFCENWYEDHAQNLLLLPLANTFVQKCILPQLLISPSMMWHLHQISKMVWCKCWGFWSGGVMWCKLSQLPFIILMVVGDILDVFELVRYHAINTCKCYFYELSCDFLIIKNPCSIFVRIELFYILCVKSVITQLHVNCKVCGGVHVHVLAFPLVDPRYQGLLAFVVTKFRVFCCNFNLCTLLIYWVNY